MTSLEQQPARTAALPCIRRPETASKAGLRCLERCGAQSKIFPCFRMSPKDDLLTCCRWNQLRERSETLLETGCQALNLAFQQTDRSLGRRSGRVAAQIWCRSPTFSCSHTLVNAQGQPWEPALGKKKSAWFALSKSIHTGLGLLRRRRIQVGLLHDIASFCKSSCSTRSADGLRLGC